ncbi:MAG: MATE family efflux transporter [Ruminococcaceae bacterium]|nr:MATE family efflux transporter [Oscillospiraceae bacterium]
MKQRAKQKNYELDMCHGPILSNMIKFALGVFGTAVLQQLFNTADLLVVGRFGHEGALASVSATTSLINLFINFFLGLSVGAGIVVAKHYGAKDYDEASKCLHTSVAISVISGILLSVVVWFLAPIVLDAMGTPHENGVFKGSVTYMRIYFIGIPFMLLYNFSASILRAVGDSRRTFFYIIQAGLINIVLNLVFVVVLDMNVAGVALATTISQGYSAIRCIFCFLHYDGVLKLEFKKIKIYKHALLSIAKLGIPSGIQSSLFSISNVIIQSSVNSFGALAMEGSGAASNIESYLYFASNAISNTVTNFTSQNYGASKPDRIKKVALYGMGLSAGLCVVLGFIGITFSNTLLGFYTSNATAIYYGKIRMTVICLSQFLCSLMEITTGLLRGIFKPVPAMISSIAGVCGFRILWIYTVFAHFHSFYVLYMSYPISWFLSFAIQGILFLVYFKKYTVSLKNYNTQKLLEVKQ